MTKHTEEAEVLIGFFTLVFPGKTCLQEYQASETHGKVSNNEDLPSAEQNRVREYLNRLRICKLMESDGMHSSAGGAGQCHCETILDYL